MKHGQLLVRTLIFGTAVLLGYVIVFRWIEHRRVVKGPWQVSFTTEETVPVLVVNQPTLGIQDLRIVFADERLTLHTNQTLDFAQPRHWPYDVPFGKCVFMDTTFLPGNVTFEMFGHQIQLLPRVLTIDRTEHPWQAGTNIVLHHSMKSEPHRGLPETR